MHICVKEGNNIFKLNFFEFSSLNEEVWKNLIYKRLTLECDTSELEKEFVAFQTYGNEFGNNSR